MLLTIISYEGTRGGHLSQDEEVERGGIDLQVAPLSVPHHGGAGGGVVLSVQAVLGALGVFELLHLGHLLAETHTHMNKHMNTHTHQS